MQRGGLDLLVLENQLIRVGVLIGLGADICEFNYKPLDLDFVPVWGEGTRVPIASGGPPASGLGSFHDDYRGGWQEVLPNGGAPSEFRGASFGQHGEVARLPWDCALLEDTDASVTVELTVSLVRSPLRLTKRLRIDRTSAVLEVEEELCNTAGITQDAMWGQHLAFGRPFLNEGCIVELDAGARVVPHEFEHTVPVRRIAPHMTHEWPVVTSSDGGSTDLSKIPPAGSPTEMAYLTDLKTGQYRVRNEHRVGVELRWDLATFPFLWLWQELGETTDYPWFGRAYLVGLEPFSSYPTNGIASAVENGTALKIAAQATKRTSWSIRVVGPPA
jgi:hypothetical protein